MRSAIRLVIGFAFAFAPLMLAAPASAGGGCHAGATQGTGAAVTMTDACFTPSILSVRPGATVTFVNEDPIVHNVSAPQWGHFEDINPGERFSVTFGEDGIYPYACMIHPGMTGAIVVGDGHGAGTLAAVQPVAQEPAQVVASTDPASSSGGWLALAAAALVVGVAVGAGVATVRRRPVRA
jgi:plastocyanin